MKASFNLIIYFLFFFMKNTIIQMNSCNYQSNMIKQFLRSVSAVNPAKLISENMKVEKGKLFVSHKIYDIADKNIYLVGFGKAVLSMAVQCEKILGQQLKLGVVCCPKNIQARFKNNPEFTLKKNSVIVVHEGAENNLPDEAAEKGTDEIITLLKKLDSKQDHLIVLISGGGSALLTKPKPGISLTEKMETVKLLMEAGADIIELNTVRKKLSLVKGGGLACLCYPVTTTCLVISDVINDPLDIIASGPTVVSQSNLDAFDILKKYKLENKIPLSVLVEIKKIFQDNNSITDKKFSHVDNFIIGNNTKALDASKKYAEELGFDTIILSSQVKGNIQDVSNFYTDMIFEILNGLHKGGDVIERNNFFKNCCFNVHQNKLQDINNVVKEFSGGKKICIIVGGETTVKVVGGGKGGRNQELALLTSVKVHNLKANYLHLFTKHEVVFLFAGTDGIDGPTDAAGAIGGSFIVEKAVEHNLDIDKFLSRNDSYNFYSKLEHGCYLIKTGHTGTNVMDVHIFIIQLKQL